MLHIFVFSILERILVQKLKRALIIVKYLHPFLPFFLQICQNGLFK